MSDLAFREFAAAVIDKPQGRGSVRFGHLSDSVRDYLNGVGITFENKYASLNFSVSVRMTSVEDCIARNAPMATILVEVLKEVGLHKIGLDVKVFMEQSESSGVIKVSMLCTGDYGRAFAADLAFFSFKRLESEGFDPKLCHLGGEYIVSYIGAEGSHQSESFWYPG